MRRSPIIDKVEEITRQKKTTRSLHSRKSTRPTGSTRRKAEEKREGTADLNRLQLQERISHLQDLLTKERATSDHLRQGLIHARSGFRYLFAQHERNNNNPSTDHATIQEQAIRSYFATVMSPDISKDIFNIFRQKGWIELCHVARISQRIESAVDILERQKRRSDAEEAGESFSSVVLERRGGYYKRYDDDDSRRGSSSPSTTRITVGIQVTRPMLVALTRDITGVVGVAMSSPSSKMPIRRRPAFIYFESETLARAPAAQARLALLQDELQELDMSKFTEHGNSSLLIDTISHLFDAEISSKQRQLLDSAIEISSVSVVQITIEVLIRMRDPRSMWSDFAASKWFGPLDAFFGLLKRTFLPVVVNDGTVASFTTTRMAGSASRLGTRQYRRDVAQHRRRIDRGRTTRPAYSRPAFASGLRSLSAASRVGHLTPLPPWDSTTSPLAAPAGECL